MTTENKINVETLIACEVLIAITVLYFGDSSISIIVLRLGKIADMMSLG